MHIMKHRFPNLLKPLRRSPTRQRYPADILCGKPNYGSAIPSSMRSYKPTRYRSPGTRRFTRNFYYVCAAESLSILLGGRAVTEISYGTKETDLMGIKIKIVIRGIGLFLFLFFSLASATFVGQDKRHAENSRRTKSDAPPTKRTHVKYRNLSIGEFTADHGQYGTRMYTPSMNK